jgi:hypothetical protein
MLNPYSTFLGDRDPYTIIGATSDRLAALTARPAAAPPPGKWSVREIICHLADCEVVFAFRLLQAVAEEHHTVQPFDQDRWASAYAAYDTPAALAVFRAVRDWNLRFLSAQPPDIDAKPLTHPERGTMPFRTLAETMAGHDLNHLRQIEALIQPGQEVA